MFSGIKSILFGYTETDAKKDDSDASALSNESSFSHDTSVLLEQTLNSATTKFSEQLLPLSPSIEQLQSSSHQLLPTLVEQHEEDEKKKKQVELNEGIKLEEDDDDCFNADSWELLDLVEKQEAGSLISTVQEECVASKASGILKQSNRTPSPNKGKDSLATQRQKPKVSFETPDLVKDKQKIERIATKDETKSSSKSKKKNKKQAKIASFASTKEIDDSINVENSRSSAQLEVSTIQERVVVKAPVLNYAAALTMKLKETSVEKVEFNFKRPDAPAKNGAINLVASLPTKRNRPVSTSSWSSNDEVEAVASKWGSVNDDLKDKVSSIGNRINDDNDSIISSGFSDCDYEYEGLNDFVMRPKKAQNKKRRGSSSIYYSMINSMSKRGGEREQLASTRKTGSTGGSQERSDYSKSNSMSSKHIKPRKKKMVLSAPTNSSDFLKRRPVISCEQPIASTSSSFAENTAMPFEEPLVSIATASSSSYLMRPPLPLLNVTSSSTSGNDSSDIADMDESWYVTPPPCFTGTNKLDKTSKPKAKEADRENALIEHPSIYIASTSASKKSSLDSLTKQKAIVLRKVNHKQSILTCSESSAQLDQKRKTMISAQKSQAEKKRDFKAWENKFIVTNWAHDEQDDLKDDFFDNLFESEEQTSSPPKQKVMKIKKQFKEQTAREEPPSLLEVSAGYESDFSITPALVGTTDNLIGDEMLQISSDDVVLVSGDENSKLLIVSEVPARRRNRSAGERKAPVQVAPIEPERQPGWQLRRKRSRRRPLSASMANTCNAAGGIKSPTGKLLVSHSIGQQISLETCSNNSSARSTPTLIDRIGSSIVANLTNLTNGFPNGALPIQAQRAAIEEVEKLNQAAVRKLSSEMNLFARRRMSKAYLDRQNDCAKLANSNRRADRRLKMYSTPNGSSVNRKVHANFH